MTSRYKDVLEKQIFEVSERVNFNCFVKKMFYEKNVLHLGYVVFLMSATQDIFLIMITMCRASLPQ